MLPFHERLARIGLEALESHGFVLAGGYAISSNGIGNRPSQDVDLFTNVYEPSLFEVSVAKLRTAFLKRRPAGSRQPDRGYLCGRFSREEVLAIGDKQEALPFDRPMLAERFRSAHRKEPAEFETYEVGPHLRLQILERFHDWADEIDPAVVR